MADNLTDFEWYMQQSMDCSAKGRAEWEESTKLVNLAYLAESVVAEKRLRGEAREHEQAADTHFRNAAFFGSLAADARKLERLARKQANAKATGRVRADMDQADV